MSKNKTKVLICRLAIASSVEMGRVFDLLAGSAGFIPYWCDGGPCSGGPVDSVPRTLPGQPTAHSGSRQPKQGGWRSIISALTARGTLLFPYLSTKSILKGITSYYRELIKTGGYRLVVLPEDVVGTLSASIIQAAHLEATAAVVVPYTVANALEPAEALANVHTHSWGRLANRWFGRKNPHWVFQLGERKMLRLTAGSALAVRKLGLEPDRPWILNSGRADGIAVESEQMWNHYLRQGFDPAQLVLTGSLAHDALFRASIMADQRREEIYQRLNLPLGRPLILTALPPNQLNTGRMKCEFDTYGDLVEAWLSSLAACQGWNVIVRQHPASTEWASRWNRWPNVAKSDVETAALIPLADVFVASVSAMIRDAVACGKPVINYDVYKYNYDDYRRLGAVVTTDSIDGYQAVIERLTGDEKYREGLSRVQAEAAPGWGLIDGRAGERMLAWFDDLVAGLPPVGKTVR